MDGNGYSPLRAPLNDGSVSNVAGFRRNVLIVAAGFFGVFVAFNAAQALSTSILDTKEFPDLGNYCLAALYGMFTIMSFPGPVVVRWLGPSKAMALG